MAVENISCLKTRPEMPEAIIGNGKMLASVRENGEIFKLFWPQIEYGQHLGCFWPGIKLSLPEGQNFTKWFHLNNIWQSSQRYLEDTNILETEMHSRTHHLKVVQQDFILPDQDILVRHYNLTNYGEKQEKLTFLVYCTFTLEESSHYDSVYIDFDDASLTFYRRHVYLAIAGYGYPLAGYQCGRRCTHSDPFQNASRGTLPGGGDNIRQSAGSLHWDMGELPPETSKSFTLYLAAGKNREETKLLLAEAAAQAGYAWLAHTKRFWRGWLSQGMETAGKNTGSAAYRRSLLAMKLMSNKETGASIAAPEFDPYYLMSGGYGYCWPRDSVYVAVAFDEAGYHEEAAQFYQFAAAVQTKEGDWQQRYFTDGAVASTWGRQIDQTGAVLWGYRHHYALTRDHRFLEQVWPSLAAGADYLARHLESNGLPSPSFDSWEDEYSQGTYSAAAVYGGLKAAGEIALIKEAIDQAEQWRLAAEKVKEGILRQQWSDRHNRFMRGINRRVGREVYDRAVYEGKITFTRPDPAGLYPTYWVGEDERVDAALLGLAFPFGVLEANDEKMRVTAGAIEECLWNRDAGGLRRYAGDNYRGGNPWLVTTFWLAIYYCLCGNRHQAETLFSWCLGQANRHLLLPEQADKNNGGPAWVLPLSWSHAMLILARLALDNKLSPFLQCST